MNKTEYIPLFLWLMGIFIDIIQSYTHMKTVLRIITDITIISSFPNLNMIKTHVKPPFVISTSA